MTFILAVKSKDGLIVSADSKELLQGGYLLWEDFESLLNQKNEADDSNNYSISPKEISDLIQLRSNKTSGRIRSINGAKKIFKITNNIALLISGTANPGGQDFSITVKEIKDTIEKEGITNFEELVSVIHKEIEEKFKKDNEEKFESVLLICGYDAKEDMFRVFRLFFNDKLIINPDGGWKKDSDGKKLKEKYLHCSEITQVLSTGGNTRYIRDLNEFNNANAILDIEQAFDLSKKIMNLAVTLEAIVEQIPSIGGKLYYAAITRKGFTWLDPTSNPLNFL